MRFRCLKKSVLLFLVFCLLSACIGSCGISEDIPSSLITASPEPEDSAPVIEIPSGHARINTFGVAWSASDSLCPMTTASRLNLELEWLLYEGLYRLDEDGIPQPVLCASARQEGNMWRLTLRTDALFSDGEPLTAADAVYSLDLARMVGSNFANRLNCITSIQVIDEQTLEIYTSYEVGRLDALLEIPIIREGTGEQSAPPGTGLYVPVLTEGETCLKSSPYRRGEVSISTIELVDIPEADLLISNFELVSAQGEQSGGGTHARPEHPPLRDAA